MMANASYLDQVAWSPARAVVPGLAIYVVHPHDPAAPLRIAIMAPGCGITLPLASVPGFLRACTDMARILRDPAQATAPIFFCPLIGDPATAGLSFNIELRRERGADRISVWAGGVSILVLESWELMALISSVSALAQELDA
jgi:hypothetical protein